MYLFTLFIVIALGRMKAFLLNLLVGGGGGAGGGGGGGERGGSVDGQFPQIFTGFE